MAATLLQVYNLTQDSTFQQRVLASAYYVARQVLSQPTIYPVNSPEWVLALSIFTSPSQFSTRFVGALATDSTIYNAEAATPGSSTDAQIITATQNVWKYLAGAIVM